MDLKEFTKQTLAQIVEGAKEANVELEKINAFIPYTDMGNTKATYAIDVDKVQEGITSLQKTLGLFGDLFVNKGSSNKEYSPRPLYRRFED